jgi:NADPH-dependent glutamate synthase beta subunit-like oxidoreductase
MALPMSTTERTESPRHAVAVVGGATAGAEAAAILAEHGVLCAVFEQNLRPYGKIEDGLPRWHDKLRRKEYDTINGKLDHPLIHFVPSTKIGADIDLVELAQGWGFSAVILANGAWRDRPFPVEGADRFLSRGLIYQNSFIYWFNHFVEKDYQGPQFEVPDGAVVVGGGLASIDVVKALQVEGVRRALAQRGMDVDGLEIEHAGVDATLEQHGLQWADLGLRGAALYYRRRIEDMPLAEGPVDGDPARLAKVEATRRKILEKAMQKYRFEIFPQHLPVEILSHDGRLSGLRFQRTRVEHGKAVPIEGELVDVDTPLVISSIGSIPEPIAGILQDGQLYRFSDLEHGRIEGFDSVFGTGNVVTGKGNIKVSRKHSIEITSYVVESFLGLGDGSHAGEEALLDPASARGRETGERVAQWVDGRAPLDSGVVEKLLDRIGSRQREVGYGGEYRDWIDRVTPSDLG